MDVNRRIRTFYLERDHQARWVIGRRRVRVVRLAPRPAGGPVAGAVFRPPVVALFVVAQVPRFAGVYELSAVWPCAADGARGDSRRPLVAELAMVGAIAAFGCAAALVVALPWLGAPAGVAAPRWVAGEVGAAGGTHPQAGSWASAHVENCP